MTNELEIKYFGWSCFAIESDNGNLLFDPFFRPMHGAKWARLEDFKNTKVICITHGHYEHYLDAPSIVNLTGATVVASEEVCNHLNLKYHVAKQKLSPTALFQEVKVSGFKITSFEWQHRNISFRKFFKGNFTTAFQFVWYSLFRSPFNAPKFGYYVEGPEGLKLMNYGEGFSNLMDIKQVRELGQKFKPNVLLAGMQLNFEAYLSDGVAALSPETVILFHPHEKLFEKFKLKSSSPQAFVESIKRKLPKAQIIIAEPMGSIRIRQTN
jgi:hypothetical protein